MIENSKKEKKIGFPQKYVNGELVGSQSKLGCHAERELQQVFYSKYSEIFYLKYSETRREGITTGL